MLGSPLECLRSHVNLPDIEIPEGRWLDLPRRGRTWLTDVPGPTPDAPAVVLLHAVSCTGMLTWFPSVEALSQRHRVVVFDQRWHGRGILSEHFSLHDCADDVAAVIEHLGLVRPVVAGYSMGSIVAQRTWRQHADLIGGLVLAATTDHFRTTGSERVFHESVELSMGALRALSRSRALSRTAAVTARRTAQVLDVEPPDLGEWALAEWRSTSPWAVGQAVAALGRHHSTPWLEQVDTPTAVIVTTRDRVIPPDRQRALAALIPDATVHEVEWGHTACVLGAERFVPTLCDAVDQVQDRSSRAA